MNVIKIDISKTMMVGDLQRFILHTDLIDHTDLLQRDF